MECQYSLSNSADQKTHAKQILQGIYVLLLLLSGRRLLVSVQVNEHDSLISLAHEQILLLHINMGDITRMKLVQRLKCPKILEVTI